MSNTFKEKDINNGTYYFFNDMISIKNLGQNKFKIDEKPDKNILNYYIGCVTIKFINYVI